MNLSFLAASILSFASLAFAASERAESSVSINALDKKSRKSIPETSAEKCSKALQGIIYTPETCAYQYLARISEEIKRLLPPVFLNIANGNLNALTSIANQYQVNIYVIPAYGYPLQADENAVAQSTYFMDAALAKNYLNIDGFDSDSYAQVFNYQFALASPDANVLMIRISLPYANAPVACCK